MARRPSVCGGVASWAGHSAAGQAATPPVRGSPGASSLGGEGTRAPRHARPLRPGRRGPTLARPGVRPRLGLRKLGEGDAGCHWPRAAARQKRPLGLHAGSPPPGEDRWGTRPRRCRRGGHPGPGHCPRVEGGQGKTSEPGWAGRTRSVGTSLGAGCLPPQPHPPHWPLRGRGTGRRAASIPWGRLCGWEGRPSCWVGSTQRGAPRWADSGAHGNLAARVGLSVW